MKAKYMVFLMIAVFLTSAVGLFFFLGDGLADNDTLLASRSGVVLQDYDKNERQLSEFKGTPLVIYTWASWCPFCAEELENLSKFKQRHGDAIHIVAINRAESLSVARDFTNKLQLPGIVLFLDPEDSFYKNIGGHAMPEAIFMDQAGETVHHQRGPMPLETMEERIQEVL